MADPGGVPSTPSAALTMTWERAMDFRTYQERAAKTDRNPAPEEKGMMIPLLGLAGEAGELLTEYKKYLRDGESHTLFQDRFAEELGDLLWYLTNVATKFGLDLADVAERNLEKCRTALGAAASARAVRCQLSRARAVPPAVPDRLRDHA